MKADKPNIFIKSSILISVLAGQITANATLQVDTNLGESIVPIQVRGKPSEACVIPFHFQDANYSAKDREQEIKLCAIDQYRTAGVCAKTNSSNPGLNFHTLPPDTSIEQLEANACELPGSKKAAKYKLSTSCSYSPSLLAYYHISRILGGIAQVPVAVLRTFDRDRHIQIGQQAVNSLEPGDLIAQTWRYLLNQLKAGPQSSKRDLLFTEDFNQSYGSLQWNPSGEEFYNEFFSGGADNISRAINFKNKSLPASLLKDHRHVSQFIGRELTVQNLQKMIQIKDASEMILLDALLNQQDRFGNIHYQSESYFLDSTDLDATGSPRLKSKKKPTEDEAQYMTTVKRMILKDNDCGVAKENIAIKAGLPDIVNHLDPKTYVRLQRLEKVIDQPETITFFMTGLQFTKRDYASFRKNVKYMAEKTKLACQAGQLNLDLDLQNHFSTLPLLQVGCDF